MKDDLISRKALLYSLRGNVLVDVTAELEKSIEEQPVAFDKKAVIKELRKYTDGPCALHECGIRSEYCSACMAKKAIEIVGKGGLI